MKVDHVRIADAVHEELLNWSRWCWQGDWPHPLPRTHCGSLESQYRAPPDWNPDDEPLPPPIRPNVRHARIVQVQYDRMPEDERRVLKAEYPARLESGRTQGRAVAAVRLGMPIWAYENNLRIAVNKVEAAFALRE